MPSSLQDVYGAAQSWEQYLRRRSRSSSRSRRSSTRSSTRSSNTSKGSSSSSTSSSMCSSNRTRSGGMAGRRGEGKRVSLDYEVADMLPVCV